MTTPKLVYPTSILDTDLYKFTMQQAVLQHFADVQATYRFTHRDKDVSFTRECFDLFRESITHFSEIGLTQPEREWLEKKCPYFAKEYLDHLSAFRFKPEQVHVKFVAVSADGRLGNLELEASGPWVETILWEVPLMASLSELHFQTADTDWNYDGQEEAAYEKAKTLLEAGCIMSEFGTRRRRSYHVQDLVVGTLLRAAKDFPGKGKVSGTSNVHLARQYDITPIGTIAHEWFMGIGALRGYEHANATALTLWEDVYPNSLQLALTDTFSTEAFFKDFVRNPEQARRWTGLRQDSGDPFLYVPRAKEIYEQLGIDHSTKTIIFSDALNVDKALRLKQQCDELGFSCSFGIGTSLTNDFKSVSSGGTKKSKALNMVIKLAAVNDQPCVKISDEITKNTGDSEAVKVVKQILNL